MNPDHRIYVLRESTISAVVTAAIGVGVAWAMFGAQPALAAQTLIVDFAPQTFMSAMLSAIVPTLLTRKRIAAGAVMRSSSTTRLPRNVLLRAALLAIAATAIGMALTTAAVLALAPNGLGFGVALWVKGAYGALVGFIVSVFAVRAALADRPPH